MNIKYRPEIDGLRAIAVFSVIIYHADLVLFNNSFLSGGFLGVDIFFVISGYLITSIVLNEIYITNNFSFKNFYERRVRRLIPSLLFVMMCSLPFAYIFLSIEQILDFSKSIIASIFFISNIYFNFTDNPYYESEKVALKPLLHTWSLSVEEQFYIFFPIFLIIIFNFYKKYLIFFIIIITLLSISFSQYSSNYHPSFNFYQILSRAFELLLGSLLSYFELNRKKKGEGGGRGDCKSFTMFNEIFPKVGISLIIFSLFFFNNTDLLPSFYTLIPLTGVCLIVWFSHNKEIVTIILSRKKFVFFGIISYSLYLFHYPIFAFSKLLEIFNGYYKFLFIFLTIIVSIFSFYFIERPFRDKKIISLKKLTIILLSSILFLIAFSFYVIKENGINVRLPKILQKDINKSNTKFYQIKNLQKVVLIGDSHAGHIEYYLNEELKKNEFSLFRFSTRMYLKDFNYVNIKTKKIDGEFAKSNSEIDNFLKDNSNLIIIFHQKWSLKILETFFNNEEGFNQYKEKNYDYLEPTNIKTTSQEQREKYIKEGLVMQIKNIINQGHKLILVYPVPEMGFNPYKLLHSEFVRKFTFDVENYSPSILTSSYEVYKRRNKLIFEILDSVQSSNIYRVYPHTFFCDKEIKNRCVANDKEIIYYHDSNHLSGQGSKFVVADIIGIIKKINK